ncbi:primosomal protein N' [Frigoribacterium sp. PhB24]|uniref:primosomal protein N' family DNA-binding protein n=1 Tax=Frigoribacterium sp. PhB24 TaxID=2485204 RepID=UPI000F96F1D3|nr:primosomal protein N' [Frigoribacterium sp. PhB24]ROS54388.1 replication restart DNA helicase PriA [Frigoribacterium sp. PhB24]
MPAVADTPVGGGPRVVRVMVESPLPQLDRLFDYAVPERLREQITPGIRVRVPLRSAGRIADGFVVETASSSEHGGDLSEIDDVVSTVSVLAPEVWRLARALADRAGGSASDVVRLAVPPRQVRVEKAHLAGAENASPRHPEVVDPSTSPTDVDPSVEDHGPVPVVVGYRSTDLAGLVAARGRAAVDAVPLLVELPDGSWVGHWALTAAQLAAVSLAAGDNAVVAVPDYRDEEHVLQALAAVLPPDRVVRLDSRQSNADRYRALLRARGDEPVVVVGNRSVLLAPSTRLGVIVVFDDGDPSFSEPLAPYVHARDTALLRQTQQESALVFLGHSRSTDVQRLVEIGFLAEVRPDPRYQPRVVPTVRQAASDGFAAQARIPSSAYAEARAAVEHGPVLIQVASPGYSPRLACVDCGDTARCLRCNGPLQQRERGATPSCAWCGALAVSWHCRTCEGTRMRAVGTGASRTADELGKAFPGVRIIVSDGARALTHVDDAPAIVVATRGAEPVAPGGYRAVLLLDGERMLARESLRVAEDCLRWWANATALAARRAPVVLVGVGGAIASALATWELARFVSAELADRRVLRFPPAVRVATVTGAVETVARALDDLPDEVRTETLGPVDVDPAGVRAIVRFDYARGHDVALALRSQVIRAATDRRKALGQKRARAVPTLRVRFDDVEPFAD